MVPFERCGNAISGAVTLLEDYGIFEGQISIAMSNSVGTRPAKQQAGKASTPEQDAQ
jgi:hypothetical protein